MRSSYLSSDVCSSDLQAAALAHGGRYPDKPAVGQRHIAQPISEYFRKRLLGRRSRFLNADVQVEFSRAVVEHRVRLGQFVALAFFSNDMQKLQTAQRTQIVQRGNQCIQVMTIYRPDRSESKFLEHSSRRERKSVV